MYLAASGYINCFISAKDPREEITYILNMFVYTKLYQIKEADVRPRENLCFERRKLDQLGKDGEEAKWRPQTDLARGQKHGGPSTRRHARAARREVRPGPKHGRIRGSGGKARIGSTVLLIRRTERTAREGRRESTKNAAGPSRGVMPVERRGAGESDRKKHTEMIPTESSCHLAPLVHG